MRTTFTVVDIHSIESLLNLTNALAAALPDGSDDAQRAERSIETLREALIDYDSPFLRHRDVILGHYSTATRLQSLVLHLWNDGNEVRLANLFGNADEKHTRIALELIASYTRHGENDAHFMRLANEIRDMRAAEKARACEMAEEHY
ncbi:MAG: hypothetical protein Q7U97_13255 [Rhodocyclaceae bacterium]|nr:hypothetical protein [Rhodocyclaceae bacterium]